MTGAGDGGRFGCALFIAATALLVMQNAENIWTTSEVPADIPTTSAMDPLPNIEAAIKPTSPIPRACSRDTRFARVGEDTFHQSANHNGIIMAIIHSYLLKCPGLDENIIQKIPIGMAVIAAVANFLSQTDSCSRLDSHFHREKRIVLAATMIIKKVKTAVPITESAFRPFVNIATPTAMAPAAISPKKSRWRPRIGSTA
ncbi:unnamed protein product, partial [marine sediment metagenome]